MRYLVILISFLFLGIFSCTKIGKNVTVQGVVKNPITDEAYDGLKVQLLVGETFALPGGFKEIKSTETDQHGKFELSAGRTKTVYVQVYDADGDYRLGWYENGEYTSTSAKEVDKGEVMNVEYHLVPYGEITIDIQNINCESAQDTMWFRQKWEYDDDFGNWSPPKVGCFSQAPGVYISEIQTGSRTYQVKVRRSGVETTIEETIFVEENELTTVELYY